MATQGNFLTVLEQPKLPGLIPSEPVAEILKRFTTFSEGRDIVINRKPTAFERENLMARRQQLDVVLASAAHNAKDYASLKLAVFGWLNGYSSLQHGDQQALGASYVAIIGELPLWAVSKAIRAVIDGSARFKNGRGGEVAPDPSFAPSAIQIRQLCESYIKEAVIERHAIVQITSASKTARPEIDEETRKRIGQKFETLAADMRGKVDAEDQAKRDELNTKERNDRQIELMERGILAEYSDAGIEPVRIKSGQLISLSLARKHGMKLTRVEKKRA